MIEKRSTRSKSRSRSKSVGYGEMVKEFGDFDVILNEVSVAAISLPSDAGGQENKS